MTVSDGGLAVALAEMAMASGIGATVPGRAGSDPIPVFFGEDQGRYLLTLSVDPQSEEWDAIREQQSEARHFRAMDRLDRRHRLKLGEARAIPVERIDRRPRRLVPRFMDQAS